MGVITKESETASNAFQNVEGYETLPYLTSYKFTIHGVRNDGRGDNSWVKKKGPFIIQISSSSLSISPSESVPLALSPMGSRQMGSDGCLHNQ